MASRNTKPKRLPSASLYEIIGLGLLPSLTQKLEGEDGIENPKNPKRPRKSKKRT